MGVIGGGYSEDHDDVVRRHAIILRAALAANRPHPSAVEWLGPSLRAPQ